MSNPFLNNVIHEHVIVLKFFNFAKTCLVRHSKINLSMLQLHKGRRETEL